MSKCILFPYLQLIKCIEQMRFTSLDNAFQLLSLEVYAKNNPGEGFTNTLALHGSTCSMQANMFTLSIVGTHLLFILCLQQLRFLLFTTCLLLLKKCWVFSVGGQPQNRWLSQAFADPFLSPRVVPHPEGWDRSPSGFG